MILMHFQRQGTLEPGTGDVPRPYRYRVPSLVYVRLDQGNGGIVRDLSDAGMAIQAVGRLHVGQSVLTRFDLMNPRARVEGAAEVVWADESGQAGLRFTEISDRARRGINDWIFTNLLDSAEVAAARDAMFVPLPERDGELLIAGSPMRAIPLRQRPASPKESTPDISLPFWPVPLSLRTVWLMMDGLIVITAVLLFWLVFMGVARSLPAWPQTVGLALGVAALFAIGYRWLFRLFAIESPGCYLATRAAAEETLDRIRGAETSPRFR